MAVPLKDLLSNTGEYKSYLWLFLSNIILLVAIYWILNSEEISSASKYTYVLMSMSLITGLLLYNVVSTRSNDSQGIGIAMLVSLVFVGIVYQFDSTTTSFHDQIFKYSTYIIGSLCVLVGLAMLVNNVYRSLRNMSGLSGFIIDFIFYLPCVINDFVSYVKDEFRLTPPVVFILFAIEMMLISGFIAISYMPRIAINLGGTPIVNDVVFIDSKYVYKNVIIPPELDKLTSDSPMLKTNRYAISLWTFLNQRTNQSNRETNIFSYGSKEGGWKPRIEFLGAVDSYKQKFRDTYRITVAPGFSYELEIASQVWNNFVFNYNGDYVDLFINGHLERSFKCIPKYNEATDQFIVGEDNGLYGAICNLNYYDEPLSLRQITAAYNLLNGRNPPINNI